MSRRPTSCLISYASQQHESMRKQTLYKLLKERFANYDGHVPVLQMLWNSLVRRFHTDWRKVQDD